MMHGVGTSAVLPVATKADLVDGTVTIPNVAPSPAPVSGQVEWAYQVTVKDRFGKQFEWLVGVPDGVPPINFIDLPRYFDTKPPLFGEGPQGAPGEGATIEVGTVSSGPTAKVTNTGTATNAKLDFVFQQGIPGPKGDGVPAGGTASQIIQKNTAGTTTEWVDVNKALVGLGNIDDTSDADKPVSTAQKTYIDQSDTLTDGSKTAASLPDTYPEGVTVFIGNVVDGWPTLDGSDPAKVRVRTDRSRDSNTVIQYLSAVVSGISNPDRNGTAYRTSTSGGFWGAWQTPENIIAAVVDEWAEKRGELVITVKDYGAKGDGITDDTAAIKAAFSAAKLANAPTKIVFPLGTYLCGGHIQLFDGANLDFMGSTFTKPSVGRSSYAVFSSLSGANKGYGSGVKNVYAKNGIFKGSFEAGGSDICGFALHHAENCVFEDITFHEAIKNGHAYDLGGCKDITIIRPKFIGFKPGGGNYNRTEAIQLDISRAGAVSVTDAATSYDGLACENIKVVDAKCLPLTVAGVEYPCPNLMGSHARREDAIHRSIYIDGVYIEEPMEDTAAETAGVLFHSMGVIGLKIRRAVAVATKGNDFRLIGIYVRTTGESSLVDPSGSSGPTVAIRPLAVDNVDIEFDSIRHNTDDLKFYQNTIYIQGLADQFAREIRVVCRDTDLGASPSLVFCRYERVNTGIWEGAKVTGGGSAFNPLNCDNIKSTDNSYFQVKGINEYVNNVRGYQSKGFYSKGAGSTSISAYFGSDLSVIGARVESPVGTAVNSREVVRVNGTIGATIQGVQATTALGETGSERGVAVYGAADYIVIAGNVFRGYATKFTNTATGTNKYEAGNL